jgi:hypothetical protein
VWSWQDKKCRHSYLDVDEILAGKLRDVPEPKTATLPEEWIDLINDKVGPHGTLVVWSNLDRIAWKTSRAFLKNAEFLIGRMYRYFIMDGSACIRLAAFEGPEEDAEPDYHVPPNDPLYLIPNSSLSSPYDKSPAFDAVVETEEAPVRVRFRGEDHVVRFKVSVAKSEVRQAGGASQIGKHAARNVGVSVVRARRELEINHGFEISYDPRERWWGIEVSFDPGLDDVFGVTNNKQAATAFRPLDLDADAAEEGVTPGAYKEQLEADDDPRWLMYEISGKIEKWLRDTLRPQIVLQARRRKRELPVPGSSEDVGTRATRRRREELGDTGESDKQEDTPAKEREQQVVKELVASGRSDKDAEELGGLLVRSDIKFHFEETELGSPAIFDIKSMAGKIFIKINARHPVTENLYEILKKEDLEQETPALRALKLMLMAWARLEDEAGEHRKIQLSDIRMDWGRMARDFLMAANE